MAANTFYSYRVYRQYTAKPQNLDLLVTVGVSSLNILLYISSLQKGKDLGFSSCSLGLVEIWELRHWTFAIADLLLKQQQLYHKSGYLLINNKPFFLIHSQRNNFSAPTRHSLFHYKWWHTRTHETGKVIRSIFSN